MLNLTISILQTICNHSNLVHYENLLKGLNIVQEKFEINTPLRMSMFLAQCLHETGCFKWLRELGNSAYFKRYDGRKDLGNTKPGDGARFKGRGFIQLTGRANYEKYGKLLKLPLLEYPEMAETYEIGALVAGLYWDTHGLNKYADVENLKKVTEIINGGLNGYDDRLKWYKKCKELLVINEEIAHVKV